MHQQSESANGRRLLASGSVPLVPKHLPPRGLHIGEKHHRLTHIVGAVHPSEILRVSLDEHVHALREGGHSGPRDLT